MRWLLAVVVCCGCYNATFKPGAPCTADLTCPQGELCDTGQSPPTCVLTLTDASDFDAEQFMFEDAPAVACTTAAQCTDPAAPVCDPTKMFCRGCEADVECPSHLCSESAGTCIDVSAALYVAPGGSDTFACTTEALPCATISGALNKLTATRRSIRVANGTYNESLVFGNSSPVLISGETASYLNTTLAYTNIGFGSGTHDHGIEDTGTPLVLEGITISGAPNEGLRVTGTRATLFQTAITMSAGGIDCGSCNLTLTEATIAYNTTGSGIGISVSGVGSIIMIDRSTIGNNGTIGLALGNSVYVVTNTFFVYNGTTGVTVGTPGANHKFEYNTVASNMGTAPAGMHCQQAGTVIGDAIFASNDIETNCSAVYSLFTGTVPPGNMNISGSPAFVSLTDFHITPGSAARSAGNPATILDHDYDGEQRPQGGARDIGADEIP